jgi:hypothetical protein
MRVVNRKRRYISYTLNILGLRVFEGMCELIARNGDEWVSIGSAKKLPLDFSTENGQESDPFLLTVSQYSQAFPGSDLIPVLQGERKFEQALLAPTPG